MRKLDYTAIYRWVRRLEKRMLEDEKLMGFTNSHENKVSETDDV